MERLTIQENLYELHKYHILNVSPLFSTLTVFTDVGDSAAPQPVTENQYFIFLVLKLTPWNSFLSDPYHIIFHMCLSGRFV